MDHPPAAGAGTGPYVQSLARGLSVISAFDAAHPTMTLSAVARRTGLTRATARRFLLTLESLGYVRSDGRDFELTPKVLELGYAYLSALSLPQLATPHLTTLSERLGESTSLSVLDGTDIVYVARVATRAIMSVTISVGTRFPAYATSMGRVLLAGLDDAALRAYVRDVRLEPLTARTTTTREQLVEQLRQVRRQGFAAVDQELEPGLRSVAAPVRDGDGTVVAAVNVSMRAGVSGSVGEHPVDQVVPAVTAAADAISRDLAATSQG